MDRPSTRAPQLTRPAAGKSQVSFTIPSCLPQGDYLFRIEHVALHSASAPGGAQFYISYVPAPPTFFGKLLPCRKRSF